MMPTCGDAGGQNKAGEPCGAYLDLGDTGLCQHHDPARAEESKLFRESGNAAKSEQRRRQKFGDPEEVPPAPETLEDATRIASWITRAVLIGEIDTKVADIGTKAVRQFQLCVEKLALLREVRELRAALAEAKKQKPRIA